MSADTVPPLPGLPAAVIFDMDGLMLDSERASVRCWARASAEVGMEIEHGYWLRMVGHGTAACEQILRERMDDARIAQLMARCSVLYDAEVQAGLPLRPGIVELLQWLQAQGIPRGVATTTRRPRAPHKLETAGLLPYFQSITAGNDVARPKPAPDIYLLAASRIGVDPARCLALEDSPAGVRAALAAGMTVIQVPDLVAPDAAQRALGHRIVDSLHQVRALLQAHAAQAD